MKFLEKDLEEIVFNSCRISLGERGLCVPRFKKRQLRIGNYGIADIVGFDIEYNYDDCGSDRYIIDVFELKQEKISMSAFLQAVRYAKGISSYLHKRFRFINSPLIRITLIGKDIDTSSDFIYLPEILDSEKFSILFLTYSYEFNGINFKEHSNYSLINEGF